VGFTPGTAITGAYLITDDHKEVITPAAPFVASANHAWKEAMVIRNDATSIPIPEIGALSFTPGTWRAGTITIAAGKTVTLDGGGDPDAQFLIQASTTMNVGAGCHIVLTNGAKAENVLWAIGTLFTASAGTDFKGSIMAGTSVTFEANVVLHGSIMAQTAVTLGAQNEVYGCVVALTAITFGTENFVAFGLDFAAPVTIPAVLNADFPSLGANVDDEFIIACMPLIDATPAECDDLHVGQDMAAMLNKCTQDGILEYAPARRTRASGSDIPQFEGDIVIVPIETLDEGGRESRNLQGAGQKERRLGYNMCHTFNPTWMHVLYCCMVGSYSFCGSPKRRRRELQETGDSTAALFDERYLPSISQMCSSQFQALAQKYLDSNLGATCFADATDVLDLKCHAILVTGGGISG
jgi:hypothetical protein